MALGGERVCVPEGKQVVFLRKSHLVMFIYELSTLGEERPGHTAGQSPPLLRMSFVDIGVSERVPHSETIPGAVISQSSLCASNPCMVGEIESITPT